MKRTLFVCLLSVACMNLPQIASADDDYDAGWAWAEQNRIVNPDDCQRQPSVQTGSDMEKSDSFIEGCMDYLRDKGVVSNDDESMPDDGDDNSGSDNEDQGDNE